MRKVTLTFLGGGADEVARKFFTWIVDGGLEDSIIDTLSDERIEVHGILDFNNDSLDIAINSSVKDEVTRDNVE